MVKLEIDVSDVNDQSLYELQSILQGMGYGTSAINDIITNRFSDYLFIPVDEGGYKHLSRGGSQYGRTGGPWQYIPVPFKAVMEVLTV
jgi:hypothetical protein